MNLHVLNCPSCGSVLNESPQANQPFSCPSCGSRLLLTDWTRTCQIVCKKCGLENDGKTRFCAGCGAALHAGCPFCYTQNNIDALVCSNCGVNLQRIWQQQRAWLASKQSNDEAYREALRAADEQGEKNYMQLLLHQLDEPENHPFAIWTLTQYGAEAVGPLIATLDSDDPDARVGAARALGDIGDPQAIPHLVRNLDDPEATVRYWSMQALGKLKAQAAVAAIGALLLRKEPEWLKRQAASTLKEIDTPEALQILQKNKKLKFWPFETR